MKNNLNKLTHSNDELRLSDVEPSNAPLPQLEPRGYRSQFWLNLFTIVLILAALLFPLAITGACNGVPGLSALFGSNSEAKVESASTTGTPAARAAAIVKAALLDSESEALADGEKPKDGLSYPRVPVVSSDIVSVGHDPKSKKLYVEFKSGRVYQYANVPKEIYKGLMEAESHGKFFDQKIKNAGYDYQKLN